MSSSASETSFSTYQPLQKTHYRGISHQQLSSGRRPRPRRLQEVQKQRTKKQKCERRVHCEEAHAVDRRLDNLFRLMRLVELQQRQIVHGFGNILGVAIPEHQFFEAPVDLESMDVQKILKDLPQELLAQQKVVEEDIPVPKCLCGIDARIWPCQNFRLEPTFEIKVPMKYRFVCGHGPFTGCDFVKLLPEEYQDIRISDEEPRVGLQARKSQLHPFGRLRKWQSPARIQSILQNMERELIVYNYTTFNLVQFVERCLRKEGEQPVLSGVMENICKNDAPSLAELVEKERKNVQMLQKKAQRKPKTHRRRKEHRK